MSWAGWMAFALYIAAARDAATSAQRARLRAEVLPLLPALRASAEGALPILETVHAIMGLTWQPDGVWKTEINRFLEQHERSRVERPR